MGAWGSGSFENDTALDWAAGVRSADDVRLPLDRLREQHDPNKNDYSDFPLDSDFACELLAAAECVAFMMGRRSDDFPDELAERLADAGEPDNLVYHRARNAVLHVMRSSELAELWEEAARKGGANEWLAALTGLLDRLNPDVPPEVWSEEDRRGAPIDVVATCAFCDGPVERQEHWSMHVDDAYDSSRVGKKSFSLHLACLNGRLHHKHAIPNLKFDPDNLPEL